MTTAFQPDIEPALACLRNGGVLLYPTDTIWGIGCDATNPEAVEKIFRIKKRDPAKSLIILLADQRDILKYIAAPDPELFDYLDALQEPTTIIYEDAIGLADGVAAADGSIGIRLTTDPFCRHLIKRLGHPLVSTSANFSGSAAPTHFSEISTALREAVDYVVHYRQNDMQSARPSQLVRWTSTGPQPLARPS